MLAIFALTALWMAGAIRYDLCRGAKWGRLFAACWAVGVGALLAVWQPLWQPFAVLMGVTGLFLVWWLRQKPSHDRDWDPSVAMLPRVRREDDVLTFENVRHFEYRSLDDFTPRYETRTVRLSNLRGADVIFFNWGSRWMSHPVLSFDFGADGRICISIEVRYRKGQQFAIVRSFYRQQELIFVVAEERDVILRRTKHGRAQTARLYHLAVSADGLQTAFLDFVGAINDLYETPRWYHGLCTNCTTTFYRLPNSRSFLDFRVLANGTLDRALYDNGRLDRSLPFDELRRLALINDIANEAPEADFGTIFAVRWKGAAMSDDIAALLRVHEYFHGASDEALRDVQQVGRIRYFAAGEIVHQPEDSVVSVGFILRGRLKSVRVDAQGRETLFRMMERGDQLGMMAGALQEPVPVRVFALEPSTVLQMDYEQAMELTLRHPDLRRLWLRTFASSLRKFFFGAAPSRAPMMLGLIHETPASRSVAERLIGRLLELGEKIAVFSDSEQGREQPGVRRRSLSRDGLPLAPEEIRRQAAEWHDANRIVFDIHAQMSSDRAERVMKLVDRAVYFVPATEGEAAIIRLRAMDVAARGWRDKLSIAWLLEEGRTVAPVVSGLHDVVCRDFKLATTPAQPPWGRSLGSGMERLVHDLRGVRIGVALGGGAARGMSHLGVLGALERNGIVVDMVAGTSAGAMTGVVYATGLDAAYSANQFAADLRPSWIFRRLPSGKQLYLLYKYRRGHFDPMLRKYLHDWRLEQLSLPCLSVTVDLVSGSSVVRERGDAAHAVLESINLPVLSIPIVRNGQALIDGGLVNNIPADVLVSMGCNFVIAVSVTAKMEKQFCEITAEKAIGSGKRPSTIQTILRSLLVQNHSLNAIGVQPADVVIEPDVTGFDLTEFMRAKELAAIGEAATIEQIPKIRQLLARLDPQLFPFSGEPVYRPGA